MSYLPRLFLALVLLAIGRSPTIHAAETAAQQMERAHHGRVTWRKFPGFQADVVASRDGQTAKGKLVVDVEGEAKLTFREGQEADWVKRALQSVINHRLDGGHAVTDVEYADEDLKHPLGRLIRSTKPAEKSLWRVQGDVLTEVQRISDKTRMIISVAEVARTPEGLHMPRSFVTTTWDAQTGAIQSSRQVFQEWQRLGQFDLPIRIIAMISTGDGERHVEEVKLSNLSLLPRASTAQSTLSELPELTVPVTSLGAAVADGHLYVFGGHLGSAHKYTAELQNNKLVRLNLAAPKAWEVVGEAPRRTGTALVGYQNRLYRVGGWEATQGSTEDDWDLHSRPDFARYDPKSNKWEDLSPLPEGRSSHDAALLGSQLYVIGGWELTGKGDGDWHNTAYVCNLADDQPQWKAIAKPPFIRRALAVAAAHGKVYVLGGMDDSNDVSTDVNIYDPAADRWSKGPALPGSGMQTFGPSAFGTEKGLFATISTGSLLRLSDDGQAWEEVTKLKQPRFFHRLVADGNRLLVVGGTSQKGKTTAVEAIEIK